MGTEDVRPENRAPNGTYLEGLIAGELRYQRCESCDAAIFYPRALCPRCGSSTVTFCVSDGLGTVYATTSVSQRDEPSYAVCLIDLDEGFRMMSTVVGMEAEMVAIGMRVGAQFEPLNQEQADGQKVRVVFAQVES